MSFITKIFGTYSERELKQIYPIVDKIEAQEPEYKALSETQLTAKTAEFKGRLANWWAAWCFTRGASPK